MILLYNVYSFKNTSLKMSIKKVWRTFLPMRVSPPPPHLYHWSLTSIKSGPDYLYLVEHVPFTFVFRS